MNPVDPKTPQDIAALAARAGIATGYTDWRGERREIPEDVITMVLSRLDEGGALGAALERRMPLVVSRFLGEPAHVPLKAGGGPATLTVMLETGGSRVLAEGLSGDAEVQLPEDIAEGYHRLVLDLGEERTEGTLIVAPPTCYEPPELAAGARAWGIAVQLYALRSEDDWGIGDFGQLTEFVREAAATGADCVGLNPLHALYRDDPERCSPYGPSSREFLNPLYIDVEAVADLAECAPARDKVASPAFQEFLAELRTATHVDYAGVADAKLDILRRLFVHFSREHLAQDTPRAAEFQLWCRSRGDRLLAFATWEALRANLGGEGYVGDWHQWPEEYRDPTSPASRGIRRSQRFEVAFAMYLQWLAHDQLEAAQEAALAAGMRIGLYLDLALGTTADGAETWMDQGLFVADMSLGAPPDPLALKGQDWGLAPVSPLALSAAAMAPFRRLLASNMSVCGAVRLDHVMSLMRLWWVPAGHDATDGLYVANPLRDLLAVLTLESQRNRCLVIGEDLGTVAPEIREAMRHRGIYSYGVLYFEKDADHQFRRPHGFREQCLVTITTHDLPTLASYWEHGDIALRRRLGLFPSDEVAEEMTAGRAWDRGALLYALEREGLLPDGMATDPAGVPQMTRELALAIEAYLARASARLMVVQPEEWLLMHEAVNIPGTSGENPNWRRRLEVDWRALLASEEARESCRRIDEERRR